MKQGVQSAFPGLSDTVNVTVLKSKSMDCDYTNKCANHIYNIYRKRGSLEFETCKDVANAIIAKIEEMDQDAIEKIELSEIENPSLKITLRNSFIESRILSLYRAKELKYTYQQKASETFED